MLWVSEVHRRGQSSCAGDYGPVIRKETSCRRSRLQRRISAAFCLILSSWMSFNDLKCKTMTNNWDEKYLPNSKYKNIPFSSLKKNVKKKKKMSPTTTHRIRCEAPAASGSHLWAVEDAGPEQLIQFFLSFHFSMFHMVCKKKKKNSQIFITLPLKNSSVCFIF